MDITYKGKRFFKRGDFRLILLYFLSEGPAHAYELIKRIENFFGGIYIPSTGVLYPALQSLIDDGLVTMNVVEGKKIYSLTKAGEAFLEENREQLNALLDRLSVFFSEDKRIVWNSLRRLVRILFVYYSELDSEKAKQVSRVLDKAKRDIIMILEEVNEK